MVNDVLVDDIAFAKETTLTKPLSLLGYGCTDLEIHFLQIKHTAIGVYFEPTVVDHLQKWKGKSGKELAEDDEFFAALASAPVESVVKVVVIKEIKASQYGTQLEGAVRDRLAAVDKYEDEEEAALEKVAEFFPIKYLKKNSFFTFKFFASGTAEITMTTEAKEDSKIEVGNANVVEMIKKWYLGGSRAVSPSTIECLANNLSAELSK
uniref:Chalcone-flavonone isomerase family protein n=1 Tax=Dianthus caryophyllus TaxID=3570 RepID=A0A3G9CLL4_DIACA|nr:enhancer of flavonoid production [Dianthus caryophyllus]BBK26424.1 enhancer of flavonoid production [Dianthus caryophyllus]